MPYDQRSPAAIICQQLPNEAENIVSIARNLNLHKKGPAELAAIPEFLVALEKDAKDNPAKTIENFLRIMRSDPFYNQVRFNLLTFMPEHMKENRAGRWSDADDAASMHHIESQYGLFNKSKHDNAFRMLLKEREYHPVREIVSALKWDGIPRIENFLIKWMGAMDNDYSREVSRLVFAGGIHRLYHPGCKFDIMVVFIGKKQGEGKSTMARWLAVNDDFYAEANEIDSQKGVEQLSGVWIAEMGELLAISRAREVEAVKAYISRQVDRFRVPYDKHPSERPRSCIFIGTTNNQQFLTDKTGNRRFFPLYVNSSGRNLYAHEAEIREEINQCWAEARTRMENGTLAPVENHGLSDIIRVAQENAVVDDWQEGRIQIYLETLPVGTKVCIQELRKQALYPENDNLRDNKSESRQIGIFMGKAAGWQELPKKARSSKMPDLGPQRCWEKQNAFVTIDEVDEVFP